MKKILLLAVLISASFAASAQTGFINGFGFKGGLNLATVTEVDDADMKPSIYVGVFKEFPLNKTLGLQTELVYSRQGFSVSEAGVDMDVRFNYINLPIMLKVYASEKFSFDVGPQFGYMVNSKVKIEEAGMSLTADFDDIFPEDREKFGISLAVGASYKITDHIDVSARWNYGINSVVDVDDNKPRNSVIQIGLGYRF